MFDCVRKGETFILFYNGSVFKVFDFTVAESVFVFIVILYKF